MSISIYEYDGKSTLVSSVSTSGILDIDDVKAFARIDDTSLSGFDQQNDAIISNLIEAVIDKFEAYTGRSILESSYLQSYNMLGQFTQASITVPHTDISVTSISFYDSDDTQAAALSSEYSIDENRGIIQYYTTTSPSNLRTFDNFQIEYDTAMYSTAEEISEDVKTALMQTITHWYENRQSVSDVNMSFVPDSAKSTFNRYRIRKV